MSGLEGRVAVVTGGRGGVGRAVCERLAAEGATVYAADLSSGGSLGPDDAPTEAPPAGSPTADGGSIRFMAMDVTSEDDVAAGMAAIEQDHGRLDVLVNAAGIEIEHTIEHTSLEDWNRIFAVNVTGTFLTCKHGLPLLRRAVDLQRGERAGETAEPGGPSIINFGSYDGFIADPELAAYCATKGAVHALTRAMACDHGPEGIRVNAVCPGYVDTPMLQSFFQESGDIDSLKRAVEDVHPMRTYGTPRDVANLVHWLASDEARYASGQLWVLDGGLSAQVQQMRL